LNDPKIIKEHSCQRTDLANDELDINLLKIILTFAEHYHAALSALKCDHNKYTDVEHNISNHYKGRAVDFDGYTISNCDGPMTWLNNMRIKLAITEIIGPNEFLVWPRGGYSQATLNQHKGHIHVAS